MTSALLPTPTPKVKTNGASVDLLKLKGGNVTVNAAAADYKDRVSLLANFSLLLSSLKLSDQHTFSCMQTDSSDIKEFHIDVVVHSELGRWIPANGPTRTPNPHIKRFLLFFFVFIAEAPTHLSVTDMAEDLEIGKPTKVGLFFCFFPQLPNIFSSPAGATNQGEIPHSSRGISKVLWRHRYYSNEFSQVILMNT